jgi:hypothetical protein
MPEFAIVIFELSTIVTPFDRSVLLKVIGVGVFAKAS